MTRIPRWSATSPALVLLVSALAGCGSLSTTERDALQSAHHNYRIGNYPDALDTYQQLTDAMEGRHGREVHLALIREASCLLRLGRSADAVSALNSIVPEALAPEDRREFRFVYAESSIERGRAEEPRHFDAAPSKSGPSKSAPSKSAPSKSGPSKSAPLKGALEDRAEIARRTDRAARHYRMAVQLYEDILDETPRNFEATRGRGVALLRLGILSRNRRTLEIARSTLRRCLQLRENDLRARFFLGLAVLYGLDEGSPTRRSGDLLLEALRLDRAGNHDFHVAYFDLYLYLRAFATPPDVRRAFAVLPELVPTVEELIDLLESYVATGRVREDASGEEEIESIRSYVATYRRWGAERDEASRKLTLARRRLKATEVGAVDRGRSAMKLVTSVPPPFEQRPEYMESRSAVQSEYAMILMESSRALIDLDARGRPRGYLDTVRELLQGPWIPQPSPIRREASDLSTRIDALEGLDRVAARSTELLNQNQVEEARAEFARYRQSLEGSAELAFVAGRIEDYERALEDPESLVSIRSAIRRGDVEEIPDDSPFATAVFRETAHEAYDAKDYDRCLTALASIERLTPSDALMRASCYHETGDHETACEVLSRIPLDDTSFFEPGDHAMAASAFLESARTSSRSSDRIARYRRAREFFQSAGIPVASIHDELAESYRNEYQALRTSSVRDPAEIEAVLENLLDLEPRDATARRELAFVLYARGSRASSSLERETAYRRAYDLLAGLEQEGELDLPLHHRRIYRRLIACYADFLPLATGNRWVYAGRNGRERVVAVRSPTATGHYEVAVDTGLINRLETWRKERGLFTRFDPDSREPTARSFPIRVPDPERGASWSYAVGDVRFDAEIIASGVTRETPAGRFTRCITVRVTNHATGIDSYHDFAPGVGEIRMENENSSYELTEFDVSSSGARDVATAW